MKNSPGNLAGGTTDQLAAAMRHRLDRIQRPPALVTGFLGQTGLTLTLDLDLLTSVGCVPTAGVSRRRLWRKRSSGAFNCVSAN
jgi:hypothetical protein